MTNDHSNHNEWDYENAEVREAKGNATSVYSVRFTRAEIAHIRRAARAAGRPTSEFIRTGALALASQQIGVPERTYFISVHGLDIVAGMTAAAPPVQMIGSLAEGATVG